MSLAHLSEAVKASAVTAPTCGSVSDLVGTHDLFRPAEWHIAIALNPFPGNDGALHSCAAYVHRGAWIGIGAGTAHDRSIGSIGSKG